MEKKYFWQRNSSHLSDASDTPDLPHRKSFPDVGLMRHKRKRCKRGTEILRKVVAHLSYKRRAKLMQKVPSSRSKDCSMILMNASVWVGVWSRLIHVNWPHRTWRHKSVGWTPSTIHNASRWSEGPRCRNPLKSMECLTGIRDAMVSFELYIIVTSMDRRMEKLRRPCLMRVLSPCFVTQQERNHMRWACGLIMSSRMSWPRLLCKEPRKKIARGVVSSDRSKNTCASWKRLCGCWTSQWISKSKELQ